MTTPAHPSVVVAGDTGPRIGVLTSGGDSQGMNAAIRAVVRTTLHLGGQPYAVHEGWAGAVAGGVAIRALTWDDVGGILHTGGTVLGTARCPEFRTRDGMRDAARNLVQHGIDRLVVIGGDGTLRGTEELRTEWPSLLDELLTEGTITAEQRQAHPVLSVVGLVGSIDNDMAGTDMTIGADTALHRIVDAIDALRSTAASHQRTFVVEVMGRHCGYLALMAAVAGAADAVFVPEDPPAPDWPDTLAGQLLASRQAGLRDLIVVVAEGATDSTGTPITSRQVGDVITDRLGGEESRVTVLGHVQRGGRPSAYDRWMPTLLGYAAVHQVIDPQEAPAQVVGVRHNRLAPLPLTDIVRATNAVKDALEAGDFVVARDARGRSFSGLSQVVGELCAPPRVPGRLADPHGTAYPSAPEREPRRIAVLHAGGVAPGMNTAVRTLVRSASVTGDVVLGVRGSVPGLVAGRVTELDWAEVDDWVGRAGAELGTRRLVPDEADVALIAQTLAREAVDALVLIGGMEAYRTAAVLDAARERYPEVAIPVVCVPATIDNSMPGAELSIGADTALNTITTALDKIRMSASATQRCFVVETMGGPCGYLALMSGLATGAERVYLPEEEIRIADLVEDAERMTQTFAQGRQLWLAIRGEQANANYSAELMVRIFEEEGGDLFDVRRIQLGHVQTGGVPTPFDRLLATRLVRVALAHLQGELDTGESTTTYVGEVDGHDRVTPIARLDDDLEPLLDRPRSQWWLDLRPVGAVVSDRHTARGWPGAPTDVGP